MAALSLAMLQQRWRYSSQRCYCHGVVVVAMALWMQRWRCGVIAAVALLVPRRCCCYALRRFCYGAATVATMALRRYCCNNAAIEIFVFFSTRQL